MGSASSLIAQATPEMQLEILKEVEIMKKEGKSDEEMTTILQAKYIRKINPIQEPVGSPKIITQKTVVVAKPTGPKKVRRQVHLTHICMTLIKKRLQSHLMLLLFTKLDLQSFVQEASANKSPNKNLAVSASNPVIAPSVSFVFHTTTRSSLTLNLLGSHFS